MPFCLVRARGSAARGSAESALDNLSRFAPVPATWQFLRCGPLALAVAGATQVAALDGTNEILSRFARYGHGSGQFPGWAILEGFLSNRDDLIGRLGLSAGRHWNDAELMAAAFRLAGFNSLRNLKGNYAICLVEPERQSIYAARDRLGGRTLYHAVTDKLLVVASRSACIATLPEFGVREDVGFLARRMALRTSPEPGSTAFAGIREFRAGEVRSWQDGDSSSQRLPFRFKSSGALGDPVAAVEAFSEAFEHAVAGVLGSRGDVAVMLSGGMDSGPTAVVAGECLADRGDALQPVSWLLPDCPRADEGDWIRLLCESIGRPLTAIEGGVDSAFAELGETACSPDLPSFNPYRSLINACYRSAADLGCAVILNGNAGDVLYPSAGWLLDDLLRRGRYREAGALLLARLLRSRIYRARRDPLLRKPVGRWLRQAGLRGRRPPGPPEWLTPWAQRQISELSEWPPEADEHPLPDYARQLTGASMAFGRAHEMVWCERFGVERRDPFHNEDLVRLMLDMPVEFSYREGLDKWLMREAMKGRMPDAFRLKRRTGLLGPVFDAGWQTHREEIRKLLFEGQTAWQRFVRVDYVDRALTSPSGSDGRKSLMVVSQCIGYAIWRRFWEG